MPKRKILRTLPVTALLIAGSLLPQTAESRAERPVLFHVQVADSVHTALSGRLLIFVKRGSGDKEVDTTEFHPEATWVAAEEVRDIKPGEPVELNADETAFPQPFSSLPPGDYEAQAVLDTTIRTTTADAAHRTGSAA